MLLTTKDAFELQEELQGMRQRMPGCHNGGIALYELMRNAAKKSEDVIVCIVKLINFIQLCMLNTCKAAKFMAFFLVLFLVYPYWHVTSRRQFKFDCLCFAG
jgi:hypothetical protein